MKYRKDAWDSTVFVKDRQSVYATATGGPQLANFSSLHPLPGLQVKQQQDAHAARSSSNVRICTKLYQQKSALLNFKKAKCMAVLAFTSAAAAEEALDIVSCELMVS